MERARGLGSVIKRHVATRIAAWPRCLTAALHHPAKGNRSVDPGDLAKSKRWSRLGGGRDLFGARVRLVHGTNKRRGACFQDIL